MVVVIVGIVVTVVGVVVIVGIVVAVSGRSSRKGIVYLLSNSIISPNYFSFVVISRNTRRNTVLYKLSQI